MTEFYLLTQIVFTSLAASWQHFSGIEMESHTKVTQVPELC